MDDATPPVLFCTRCGANLPAGAANCPECKTRIAGAVDMGPGAGNGVVVAAYVAAAAALLWWPAGLLGIFLAHMAVRRGHPKGRKAFITASILTVLGLALHVLAFLYYCLTVGADLELCKPLKEAFGGGG